MIGFIFSKLAVITKTRIPTILGLALVAIGLGAGVFLVFQNQTLTTKASADQTPQNVTISNLEDSHATISWQTNIPTTGFITFGTISANEQTILDDRDQQSPKNYYSHYLTLTNLNSQTTYQYKIISGKVSSDIQKFTTAAAANPNGLKPITGTVVDKNGAINDGLAFLAVAGAIIQSAPIKNGNFILPISQIRQQDLNAIFIPKADTIGKISIVSTAGDANILVRLLDINGPLPTVKLGDNLDLTLNQPLSQPTPTPTSIPNPDLLKYDLTGDGIINSSDYSVVLRNFGKSPQNKRADLNGDGVVDQKDLELMSKEINRQKR